jgi:glutaredoxin
MGESFGVTIGNPQLVDGPWRNRQLLFFSLSSCVICSRARKYLEDRGYAYRLLMVDELSVEEKERLKEELTRKHGIRPAFPALSVDDNRLLLGFFPKAWDKALGEGC